MSEYISPDEIQIESAFDKEFNDSHTLDPVKVPQYDINSFSRQEIFRHDDPLLHAHAYEMPKMNLMPNEHFVKPHEVEGYFKGDGTYVEGYYRDGDDNTDVNRSIHEGGGYTRSNPITGDE